MNPPTPPRLVKKTKDRTVMAIVLTVLLHAVFAIIVYFTVFDKEAALQPLPSTIDPSTTTTLQTQPSLIAQEEAPLSTELSSLDKDTDKVRPIKTTDISQKENEPKVANVATREKPIIDLPSKVVTDSSVVASSTEEKAFNSINNLEINNKDKSVQYKLKQTQEYEKLEGEIEKDSEKLSELINEVKKYNQSKIQQHQTPITSDEKNSPSAVDYANTPITNLSSEPTYNNKVNNDSVTNNK